MRNNTTNKETGLGKEATEYCACVCVCVYLMSTARKGRVWDLRFNPAVFLDVVEIKVIIDVCLQKKGEQFWELKSF